MNTTKSKQNKIITKSYDSFCELDFFQSSSKKSNQNQNLTLSELNPKIIELKSIYFSYSVVTHNSLIRIY